MRRFRTSKPLIVALWANALAVGLIAIALFSRASTPNLLSAAMAQNQLPIGGGAGVFITPGQFSTNTYGCYVMDVDAQTLCAYQYYPADKQLRLIASRTFRHDRKLSNYNTAPPPNEIRGLVEKEQNELRAAEEKKQPASPEQGK